MIINKIKFINTSELIFLNKKYKNYHKFALLSFLNNNIEIANPFNKFDIAFFAYIVNERFISIYAICLNKSISPSRPKRCSHKFCYKCNVLNYGQM